MGSLADPARLRWRYDEVGPADPTRTERERRKVSGAPRRGRSDSGHTFGDDLTDAERMAVIEYLKTL